MKVTYRIPAKVPFGYIEIEQEMTSMSPFLISEIITNYDNIVVEYNQGAGDGLTDKEMNAALDEYLSTATLKNGTELYAKMNAEQQKCFQAIKRSINRIKTKNGNNNETE